MRRYDLDWLRVILFGMLLPYHAMLGFSELGTGIYGFANDDKGGVGLVIAHYFSHSWRLPALFVVAGVGTYFATSRTVDAWFLLVRMARLLVPVAFGFLILNAPANFTIEAVNGRADDFWEFWSDWVLQPDIRRSDHLWFLINLAAYTAVCWPLFRFRARLEAMQVGARPLLLAIVLGSMLTLVPVIPFFEGAVGDGYQWVWYLGFFVGGYLIGAQHVTVLDWLKRRVFYLLPVALVVFVVEFLISGQQFLIDRELGVALSLGGWATNGISPAFTQITTWFSIFKGLNAWLWCLVALGLAARYLNRPGRRLSWLSDAVYPFYVLHFPFTIVGLGLLTITPWPWQIEFLLLAAGVLVLTLSTYIVLRRAGPLAYLVGGRLAPRSQTAPRAA